MDIDDSEFAGIAKIIETLAESGRGFTIRPISKGQRSGGLGSDDTYPNDGWEVGWIDGNSGGELARAATIDQAISQALFELGY